MLTGLYPHHHGIVHNGCKTDYIGEGEYAERMIVEDDVTTDRILAEAGYDVSFFGRFHLTDEYGPPSYYKNLYREMQEYRDGLNAHVEGHPWPPGTEIMHWYQWQLPTQPSDTLRSSPTQGAGLDGWGLEIYQEFIRKMGRLMLPHEMCFDQVVAALTEREIREADGGFAVTCSFGAPHDPWAAPEPYYSMYNPADIGLPETYYDPNPDVAAMGSRKWAEAIGDHGVREYIRVYYAQLSFIDEQVGRVISALRESDQLENTLIVFTADHGDMLGHHRLIEKAGPGLLFMDQLAHIPLILSCPGVLPAGLVVDVPVSQVDVMPTILDCLSFDVPTGLDGRSLRPLIQGSGSGDWRAYAFAEISGLARPCDRFSEVIRHRTMVRTRDWKCVFQDDQPVILFDRTEDPLEQRNALSEAPDAVTEEMRALLGRLWG